MAIAQTDAHYIISDSQTAVRNFANGRISPEALRILRTGKTTQDDRCVCILWFPAHTPDPTGEVNPNEAAHNVARGLTFRAMTDVGPSSESSDVWEWEDRMTTFNDITKHYKLQRRVYPPPHLKLNRSQSVQWRQLQTRSYKSPALLHVIYPDIYTTDQCKDCEARATLEHILWECQGLIHSDENAASTDSLRARWRAALLSSALDDQLWAIQRAEEAARRQDLLADT